MTFTISSPRVKYIVLTIPTLILAILLKKYISNLNAVDENKTRLIFSSEELQFYNGIFTDKLYLSVVGSIFDVTEAKQHYAQGSPYHYFVGKDGTRALVSGDFKDESIDKDHILDLSCDNLFTILSWRQTFRRKYRYVGFLSGRFYDKNGSETPYMVELKQKLKICKIEREETKKQERIYPPCNIAWSEENGTRLWCTKTSGGVLRSWVGVPRQMFTPGEEKPKCVCVNLEKIGINLLKEYDGCPSTSSECSLVNQH